MQQGSKLLKVVSIIMIVWGVIVALLGILAIAGGAALSGNVEYAAEVGADSTATATTYTVVAGALLVITGLIELVIGIVGLKASGRSGKNTLAFVLGIIGVVSAGISLVEAIASGGDVVSSLISLILPVLFLVGVNQTRQGIS